jgi:transcriptional regulator with XRE-family HTH domain
MGHVERGEKNVSLSTVLRVANALGVRIPALFGRVPEASTQAAHPQSAAGFRPDRSEVNHLLDELQAQRKALRQALRDLSRCLVRLTDSVS